ncbi:MAG: ABC transporter permease [Alphaproteobacteria bacterium]|nr:ABC transporter permease [Alphaproteobacteria bacterium]
MPPNLIWRRTRSMVLRHVYILLQSWPRMLEMVYWPALNIVVWGFMNEHLTQQTSKAEFVVGLLMGAIIMWEVTTRSILSVSVSFLEELWSRNLGQLFASPLKPSEYAFGLIVWSVIRTTVAIIPCVLIAWIAFDYWIFGMGYSLIGFYVNLMISGWWCGFLVMALLLRFGVGAEWMSWIIAFSMLPFVAVFYPVSVLPEWMQTIAWFLPPTYAFEGMRSIANLHVVRYDLMFQSLGLNLLYTVLSAAIFMRAFEKTRRQRGLLQVSE